MWVFAGFIISFGGAGILARYLFPLKFAVDIVHVLGDVSVALFGIFGIWLGLSYHDDFIFRMNGKSGEALEEEAKAVLRTSERCRVLFHGFSISTGVFVFTLLCRIIMPALLYYISRCLPHYARLGLKALFLGFVIFAVLAQLYSLLASVAVMIDSSCCVEKAQETADRILKSLRKTH